MEIWILLSYFFIIILGATSFHIPDFFSIDGRLIIGGQPAPIEEFKYMLSLRFDRSHFCGAAAVTDEWAITAAHCVEGFSKDDIDIGGGSADRNNLKIWEIDEIVLHPGFNYWSYDNDVALMRIRGNFSESMNVNAIPIIEMESNIEIGTFVNISGWGTVKWGESTLSDILQYAEVQKLDYTMCNELHGNELTENMMCAAYVGRDSCLGDDGGPLVYNGVLAGIFSWRIGCGFPEHPSVYTRMASVSVRNFTSVITGV